MNSGNGSGRCCRSRSGRPRVGKLIANRVVFEGILRVLWTGAPWKEGPKEYSSGSTCWRRLKQWEEQGFWLKAWRCFLGELDAQDQLDWSECFADGSFAPAKKGALRRKDRAGQGHEVDGGGRRQRGVPLGIHLDSASSAEVALLETTLANVKGGVAGHERSRVGSLRTKGTIATRCGTVWALVGSS